MDTMNTFNKVIVCIRLRHATADRRTDRTLRRGPNR
jgi:hypothetical protein